MFFMFFILTSMFFTTMSEFSAESFSQDEIFATPLVTI